MVLDTELNHKIYQSKEKPEKDAEQITTPVSIDEEFVDDVIDYYQMTKPEQVKELKNRGLTYSEIRKLSNEELRVKKLVELDNKGW